MRIPTLPAAPAEGAGSLRVRDHLSLPAAHRGPVLDVVVPVHNEEVDLEPCVRRLHAHLGSTFPYPFRITIADNASTDGTRSAALALERALPEVTAVHLREKGRGRALRATWSASDAPVLAYMDVDLSTDLAALLPLVAPLISGHSDLAIGSRLSRGSRVVRGPKREVISRCYNLILRGTLAARFQAARRRRADPLLHRRRSQGARRRQRHLQRHRPLGGTHLRIPDRRRGHPLRPRQGEGRKLIHTLAARWRGVPRHRVPC
jgi:glycosyltransferase involved in cell wall biosynthesis